MKSKPTFIILVILLILLGGAYWLSVPPSMPPIQKMQQTIPDDHIPR